MKQGIFVGFTVVLLLISTSSARTKEDAIQDFFDSLNTGFGYSEVTNGPAGVSSTTKVIEMAPLVQYFKLDKDKLYHFFQVHQNNDSGFGEFEGEKSSFNASIEAAKGLHLLGFNFSMVSRWGIMNYLNESIIERLTEERVEGNVTVISYLDSYSGKDFVQVTRFLEVSHMYNYKWNGNLTHMVLKAWSLQYKNGSFASVYDAWAVIQFLVFSGYGVLDSLGAQEYLLAHQSTEGGFSKVVNQTGSLEVTWEVLMSLASLGYDLQELPYFEETVKFILELQDSSGGFHEVGGSRATASLTFYALSCLALLGRLSELQRKELLQAEGFIGAWSMVIGGMGVVMGVLLRRGRKYWQ